MSLLIPAIDDVYELFWNGVPVGHLGSFPPRVDSQFAVAAQTYNLGPARSGVLAVRVFKLPSMSVDDGTAGGFEGLPLVGSPKAILPRKRPSISIGYAAGSLSSASRRSMDWRPYSASLPGSETASSGCCSGWQRTRSCRFWRRYSGGLRLPVSGIWLTWFIQTGISLREVSQWFLLIYLLQLNAHTKLLHAVRIAACIGVLVGTLDGALAFAFHFNMPAVPIQIADAVLTAVILPLELVPVLLVIYAILQRQQLDSARWLVAIFALLSGTWYSFGNIVDQGIRFTHWTLGPTNERRYSPCSGTVSASRSC